MFFVFCLLHVLVLILSYHSLILFSLLLYYSWLWSHVVYGAGRGPVGRHHGQVRQPAGLGCQQQQVTVVRHR